MKNRHIQEIYKIEKEAKYLGIQVGGKGSDIYAAEN